MTMRSAKYMTALLAHDTARRTGNNVPKLTRAQREGMERIRDRGPNAWAGWGSRAGGAISRMFDRLAAEGLVEGPPYKVTARGHEALKAATQAHVGRIG